jgi:hypothetical protein
MQGWIEEAKKQDILTVALSLGLDVRRGKFSPCPYCSETVRSRKDSRPSCEAKGNTQSWWCVPCNQMRDVIDLVSGRLHGKSLRDCSQDQMGDVRQFFAEHGWCEPATGPKKTIWIPPPSKVPIAPPNPPNPGEIYDFLKKCIRIQDCKDRDVLAFLASDKRKLDPKKIPAMVPPRLEFWPKFWWWGWDYPIIVSAYNAKGQRVSIHGRSLREGPEAAGKKTRWPVGASCKGLVFACPKGRAFLKGEAKPSQVILVEGATDFLSTAQAAHDDPNIAVIGGTSGSWSALEEMNIPTNTVFYVGVDSDEVGDRYAQQIAAAIGTRACVRRIPLGELK